MGLLDLNEDDERESERKREIRETYQKLRQLYFADKRDPNYNPFTRTLGSLLRMKREQLGLSRAALAKTTQINQNSLAKYEQAGEESGQYPPLPKLAQLCMALRIDPREALAWSVDFDFSVVEGRIRSDHMEFENFLHTLDSDEKQVNSLNEHIAMLSRSLEERIRWYDDLEEENEKLREELRLLQEERNRLSHGSNESGPDQEGPSRQETSTNNSEAAPTASTKPKKGKD